MCLACRSRAKAEAAAKTLQKRHPNARLEVVLLNTASLRSVFAAASELRERLVLNFSRDKNFILKGPAQWALGANCKSLSAKEDEGEDIN